MPVYGIWIRSGDGQGNTRVYGKNSETRKSEKAHSQSPCHCRRSASGPSVCSNVNNWCYPPPYSYVATGNAGQVARICEASSAFQFSGMDWKLRQQRESEEANKRLWQRYVEDVNKREGPGGTAMKTEGKLINTKSARTMRHPNT